MWQREMEVQRLSSWLWILKSKVLPSKLEVEKEK